MPHRAKEVSSYEASLKELQQRIKHRQIHGFTFIYKPKNYEGKAFVFSSAHRDKNHYGMMVRHMLSLVTSVVEYTCIAWPGDERCVEEVITEFIDKIKRFVPDMVLKDE